MKKEKQILIKEITDKIPFLTEGQIYWLDRVIHVFDDFHKFEIHNSDLFDNTTLENFGDALRIHHSFSKEPFSKDKFEYVLEKVLGMSGHSAKLASRGNRGDDIIVNGCPISLKTQADKNIKIDKIWISKFMELGKGKWGDDPEDLKRLRSMFLLHLESYERILSLRALKKSPIWLYELVEIPVALMKSAKNGRLEMKLNSKQFPKPGYCYVKNSNGEDIFQLYFDGGGERKLQVKNLLMKNCVIHATWEFTIQD